MNDFQRDAIVSAINILLVHTAFAKSIATAAEIDMETTVRFLLSSERKGIEVVDRSWQEVIEIGESVVETLTEILEQG